MAMFGTAIRLTKGVSLSIIMESVQRQQGRIPVGACKEPKTNEPRCNHSPKAVSRARPVVAGGKCADQP